MSHIILKNAIKSQKLYKSGASCHSKTCRVVPFLMFAKQRLESETNYSTMVTEAEQLENVSNQPKPVSDIPGLKSWPIIGSMPSLAMRKDLDKNRIHIFWKKIYEEFGPIFQMKLPGRKPIVALFRPEDFEVLYRITMDNPVRDPFFSMKKIRDEAVNNYFEKKGGLLIENNEEWWRVRSKVQTPMMKPKNIARYLPKMDEVTLDFMDRIADFQNASNEMPENFLEELYKWSLESVSLVALNRRLGCLNPNLPKDSMQINLINSVNDIFAALNKTELGFYLWRVFPSPALRKLRKAHNTFLEIADANIRETEAALIAKGEVKDEDELTLMESLLRSEGLTRKDVVTLILDMLFAGIDTTSHAVGFALYLLAKNPEAQKKLQNELDEVLGDGKEVLTASHLAKLSYLKACVKESLRMLPVTIGTGRRLEKDTVLLGYHVPKGYQVVNINIIAGWDKRNFERVDEFLPERWSRGQPYGAIHPFAVLPFSHGTRMCIGRRIAEQEIYTFLARTLHRYNIEYHYEDMEMKTCLVFKPANPLKFKITARKRN